MLSHNAMTRPPAKQRSLGFSLFTSVFAALSLMMILSVSAQAATPLAGATISNQATANYKDSGGTDQVASSNAVTTTVAQVGSYTLNSNNSKTAAPGTTVYMPHILTNTGNGTDTFSITLPGFALLDADLNSLAIFADTDNDGNPNGAALCTVTPTTSTCTGTTVQTGALAPGGTFNFVVAMAVKATAADAATAAQDVTAVPVGSYSYNPATLSNTDTLTVANSIPVFAVTKSIVGQTSGPIGSTVEYRLSYTNSGNAAGPLYIKDVIGGVNGGITASYSYVANSATWSNSVGGLITDTIAGDPAGLDYLAAVTSGTGADTETTIEAVVASVPANGSGFITFRVKVDALAPLGTSETTNVGSYARANNGTSDCSALPCTPTGPLAPTNQSPFTVIGTYGVIANDNGLLSDNVDDLTVTGDNLVTAPTAAPGAVVPFEDFIWNTGDTPDTFNITFNDNVPLQQRFPTGTTFQVFQADGVTPLLSSDPDGVPDTGSISPGSFYKIVVKATLPANACSLIDCTALENFTFEVTATSKGDLTKSNAVYNQLTEIDAPEVDLTNGGTLGVGPGVPIDALGVIDPTAPITTVITPKTVAPGSAAQFDLSVINNGPANDNYDLSYHLTAGSTIALNGFVPGTLLSGWSVTFHSGVCSATLGSVVSNTGTIAPTDTATFCAVVNTPASGATAAAGTYNAYFKVTSGATLASDIKLDAVILSATNNLTLTPIGTGQIQPGGTILYPHILANGGNNVCTGAFTFDVTNNGAANGLMCCITIKTETV